MLFIQYMKLWFIDIVLLSLILFSLEYPYQIAPTNHSNRLYMLVRGIKGFVLESRRMGFILRHSIIVVGFESGYLMNCTARSSGC